jgi:hypothetical protein
LKPLAGPVISTPVQKWKPRSRSWRRRNQAS